MHKYTYYLFFLFILTSAQAFAATIYVDLTANGANNGSSWNNAFTTLQPAINAAVSGDQIWVAEGTYNETRPDPTGALVLKANVSLYGGFRGNENNINQRNYNARVTIIDGSVARAGAAAYHVAIGAASARVDGFTVQGGNANGGGTSNLGGGIYNTGAGMIIENCKIISNRAVDGGGVYHSAATNISIINCTFDSNIATGLGGGLYAISSSGQVTTCTFTGNSSVTAAAVYLSSTNYTISKCIFEGNSATAGNGGAIALSAASPSVVNCIFHGNTATGNGGAFQNVTGSAPAIMNCTIANNAAGGSGGAIYNNTSTPVVTNSILWGNTPDQIGGAAATVTYCVVQGGYGVPANQNLSGDPMFADAGTGDFRLKFGSPAINTGTASGAPTTDIRNTARPQSGAFDRGAYEMAAADYPTVDFFAIPVVGNAPQVVQFTDTTTSPDPILGWSWTFGDLDSSNRQNPDHLYSQPNTYTVTLAVTTLLGTVQATKLNYITINPPASGAAEFLACPTVGAGTLTTQFTDLSPMVLPPLTTISAWNWNFGDTTTSTMQNPLKTYTAPGQYTVTLTITTSLGTFIETKPQYINVQPAQSAQADFMACPTSGIGTLTTQFTDISIPPALDPITAWSWNFGDSGTSSVQNPVHSYNAPGSYTVSLTITTASNATYTETKTAYINVSSGAAGFADFMGFPASGSGILNTQFADISMPTAGETITGWSWNFGDSGTSTLRNPVHTYTVPGNYTVSLTVTTTGGTHFVSKPNYISLVAGGAANFSANPTTGAGTLTTQFTDLSIAPSGETIVSWDWDFGDGNTSVVQNPSHTYAAPGTYTVTLRIFTTAGPFTTTKPNYIVVDQSVPAAGLVGLVFLGGILGAGACAAIRRNGARKE